jgi:predicted RNA binding protein with dsRBD fold (UPF0201 family)
MENDDVTPSSARSTPSPGQPKRPLSDGARHGALSTFFAGLAGYDLQLISQYAGSRARHERLKLVAIGISVLVPTILGFFTSFLYFEPHLHGLAARVVFSLIVSLIILLVDCLIVRTLSRSSVAGVLARILMSVCLGFVIAEPLVLALYEKTINAHIVEGLNRDRKARGESYQRELDQIQRDIEATTSRMLEESDGLKKFSSEQRLDALRDRLAAKQDDALTALRIRKQADIDQLNATKSGLQTELSTVTTTIESKLVIMQQEIEGKRESNKPGKGHVYLLLQDEVNRLRGDKQRLEGEIQAIDGSLRQLQSDRSNEARLQEVAEAQIQSLDASKLGELSLEDRLNRERLESSIAQEKRSLDTLNERKKQIESEFTHLPKEFALSQRNDPLEQTRALYEILWANAFLRVKVAALFLLLFLCDVTPVIIKLTAKTGYDDYQMELDREHVRNYAAERDAQHEEKTKEAIRRIHRVRDVGTTALASLSEILAEDSKRLHSIRELTGQVVHQEVYDAFREGRNTNKDQSAPSRGLFSLLVSTLKHGLWVIRMKFSS